MIDLGDPVPLSVYIVDDAGNPANAGAVTVTVTLPDGSTANPAVANAVVGTYTATYVPTQVGRHTVRWVATGANANAYDDVFEVYAADPGLIISVDEARAALRIPNAQTVDDDDLRELIAAATGPMEDICGPILRRNCDEWHDGGGQTVRLLQAPIISVSSVLEAYGAGYTRTLTLQNLDAGSFDAFGYTVDLDDAILTRRTSGQASAFVGGRRNVHVVYVAGRAVPPANILRATRRLVRWLWQSENQRPGQNAQQGDPVITPSGFAVPRDVVQLCASEVRIPGIA